MHTYHIIIIQLKVVDGVMQFNVVPLQLAVVLHVTILVLHPPHASAVLEVLTALAKIAFPVCMRKRNKV